MYFRKRFIVFVFTVFSLSAFSQGKNTIDSLKRVATVHATDTTGVIALNDLCWYYKPIDSDSAMHFATLALKQAMQINYSLGIAQAYNNTGNVYNDLGDYEQSLKNHLSALAIREKIKDKKGIASSLNNIGILYKLQGNLKRSLEYQTASIKIREELKDQFGIAASMNNIGNIHILLKENDIALEYYTRALKIREEINDKQGIGACLNNIATVYYEIGNKEKALDYYLHSLVIAEEIGNSYGISSTLNNIGSIYCVLKQNEKALEYLNRSIEIAKQTNALDLEKEGYKWLAETYAQMGDYEKAFRLYGKFSFLRDSIFAEESNARFHEMEAKYGKKKSEEEIEALTQKDSKNRIIIYIGIGGIVLILLLSLLLLSRYKVNQRLANVLNSQKLIVEEKNNELERLSIVASETENVILIMDAEGKLEWVNSSFEKLNAISLSELKKLKGETIYDLSNNPKIRDIINEAVQNKKPVTYESLNKTIDGKTIWESSTLSPIFDANGKLRKLIIIDSDITDRKNAEELVHEKNKEILDSIHYARRIQSALLASHDMLQKYLPDHFVFYKPKDIVSGDFYWAKQKENYFYIATADCTGHGVPGAFMSLLNISFLNETISGVAIPRSDEILNYARKSIIESLKTDGSEEGGKDGMDAVVCRFDFRNNILELAAANNPVWIIRDGNELMEIKPDKMPVGKSPKDDTPFTAHTIKLKKGDIVYTLTDGYCDQFGGPKGKKFKYKPLQELLMSTSSLPMNKQKEILDKTIEDWKGNLEQLDDILVIGIRV